MSFRNLLEKNSIVFDEKRINKETELFEAVIREANFPDNSCDIKVYLALLPFTIYRAQIEQMWIAAANQEKAARLHAAKLAFLFGNTDEALAYLDRFAKQYPRSVQTVHDACLFSLPESKEWNSDLWRGLVLQYSPSSPNSRIMRLLSFANKIEKFVTDNKAQLLDTIAHEIIGNEYDALMQKQSDSQPLPKKVINRQVEKEFDSLIRAELNFFAKGRLDDKQREQYHLKKQQLITQGKKEEIKNQIIKKLEEKAFTVELPTQFRDDYINDKLGAVKGLLKTKLYVREHNLLSLQTPLETLENYASHVVYQRSHENVLAAALFFQHKISEVQFNRYLDLTPIDDPHHIPALMIKGEEISPRYKKYYLKKLSPTDPRAALLGKLTSCCQTMGDAGTEVAIHGITDPRGGFYVLCEMQGDNPDNDDTIVAQAWAWKDEVNNHLVFDSVESQIDFRNKNSTMLSDFYTLAAHQLINLYSIASVRVGAGGNTPAKLGIVSAVQPSKIADYQYDLDSNYQRIIADINFQFFLILFYKLQTPASALNTLFENQLKSPPNRTMIDAWCDIAIMENDDDDRSLIEGLYDFIERKDVATVREKVERTSNWIRQLDNLINNFIKNHDDFSESAFLKIAQDAINAGVNINIYNRANSLSALYFAVILGYLSVVKLLLEHGAEIEATDNQDANIIDAGIKKEKWDVLKCLLEHLKVKSGGITPEHTKVLFAAANSQQFSLLSYLINEGLSINTLPPPSLQLVYQPLLHMAITKRQTDLRDFLIANGADVNLEDENGLTPLMRALQNEDFETFEYLIQHGADINKKNKNGQTILLWCNSDDKWQHVSYLLLHGADANIKDNRGQTLLLLAAEANQWDIVSLLLDHKLEDVDAKNSNGETVLILAIKAKKFDIVQKLVKNGADINVKDKTERAPLHHLLYDCFNSYENTDDEIDVLNYLLEKGADVNVKGEAGQTPLHLITINRINSSENTEIALCLLKSGADIEAVNDKGQSVLSRIVECGPVELVKTLINEKYATIDVVLEQAVFHKRFEVINAFTSEINGLSGVTSRASFFQKDKKNKEANDKLKPDIVRNPLND